MNKVELLSPAGDLEKLNHRFKNFEITPDVYANNLYFISCKT